MARILQALGIASIFGLFVYSVGYAELAMSAIPDQQAQARAELDAQVEAEAEAEAAEAVDGSEVTDEPFELAAPPDYLAFTPGFVAGSYNVLDAPGSDDEDIQIEPYLDEAPAPAGVVRPGVYASAFDAVDCSYELHRVLDDREEHVIGADHIAAGRALVTINEIEPDRFSSTPGCGEWREWTPLAEPLTVAGNGDYWIGDLAHGQWEVPADCDWEEVVGFRGANIFDTISGGTGPDIITVDDESMGFRIRWCTEPLRLLSR